MQEIVEKIKKDLYCPACGKQYEVSEIKVRGVFNNTIIIQTTCTNGHATVFMTTIQNQKKEIEDNKPVTIDEALDLSNALKAFNGDFSSLWKN